MTVAVTPSLRCGASLFLPYLASSSCLLFSKPAHHGRDDQWTGSLQCTRTRYCSCSSHACCKVPWQVSCQVSSGAGTLACCGQLCSTRKSWRRAHAVALQIRRCSALPSRCWSPWGSRFCIWLFHTEAGTLLSNYWRSVALPCVSRVPVNALRVRHSNAFFDCGLLCARMNTGSHGVFVFRSVS